MTLSLAVIAVPPLRNETIRYPHPTSTILPTSSHCGPDPQSPPQQSTLMSKRGYVYILTNNHNTTLYTGVTNDLMRRTAEHKLHINKCFTSKYKTEKLVYYEIIEGFYKAIQREKQLKNWHREWKEALINDFNPEWKDLSEDIGVNEEYMQSVKEAYSETSGDCGSNPQ